MDQRIIDKLNIKITEFTLGSSKVNGILIYLWPGIVKGYKTYITTADEFGELLPENVVAIYLVNSENTICLIAKTTNDFLLNVDSVGLKNLANTLIN